MKVSQFQWCFFLLSAIFVIHCASSPVAPWELQQLQKQWGNPLWGSVVYCNDTGVTCGIVSVEIEDVVLTGKDLTLPSYLCQTPSLNKLILNNLQLTGTIPSACALASHLDLGSNLLSGTISEKFFDNGPTILILRDNYLSGTIPAGPEPNGGGSSPPQWMDLSSNNFMGSFPTRWFQHSFISTINLAFNAQLQGTIPEDMVVNYLTTLLLQNTNFSGKIPKKLCEVFVFTLQNVPHLDCGAGYYENELDGETKKEDAPPSCCRASLNCGKCSVEKLLPLPEHKNEKKGTGPQQTTTSENITVMAGQGNPRIVFWSGDEGKVEASSSRILRFGRVIVNDDDTVASLQVFQRRNNEMKVASAAAGLQSLKTSMKDIWQTKTGRQGSGGGVIEQQKFELLINVTLFDMNNIWCRNQDGGMHFSPDGKYIVFGRCRTPNGTMMASVDVEATARSGKVVYGNFRAWATPDATDFGVLGGFLSEDILVAARPDSTNAPRSPYKTYQAGVSFVSFSKSQLLNHVPLPAARDGYNVDFSVVVNRQQNANQQNDHQEKKSAAEFLTIGGGDSFSPMLLYEVTFPSPPLLSPRATLKQKFSRSSSMNFGESVFFFGDFLFIGDSNGAGGQGTVSVYQRNTNQTSTSSSDLFVNIQTLMGDYSRVCAIGGSIHFDGELLVLPCTVQRNLRSKASFVAKYVPERHGFRYTNPMPVLDCQLSGGNSFNQLTGNIAGGFVFVGCGNATLIAPVSYFQVPP